MPGYYSELQADMTYRSLPETIDEEELEVRVTALRSGDLTQVNPISMQLMRISLSVVARFAHPKRTPDLIGVALLTLVESVKRASTELVDGNIVPYVMVNIANRLKDAIADDHTVRTPSRTLRDKRSKGIELTIFSNRHSSEEAPHTDEYSSFYLPAIAREETPEYDTLEILEKIAQSDRDRLILDLRSKSYTLQECAKVADISVGLACKIKQDLYTRFLELNNV